MVALYEKIRGDRMVWVIVLLLSVVSILVVYSSTGQLAYKYKEGNTFYYFFKHFIILFMGLGIIYLTHKIKYSYYSRIAQVLYWISLPLLLLTMIIGVNLNGASRWVNIFGISFQPSDLAKLALIMYLARILSRKQDKINDFKEGFLPIVIPVLVVCALILPADFSTTALIFATSLVIMFIGRVNWKFLGILIGSSIVGLVMFILIAVQFLPDSRVQTWENRLENFWEGGDESNQNYQANLAKSAIANGGTFGTFFHGENKNALPQAYSDYVYASIIEEIGMVGGLLVLFLYILLFFRSIKIAIKCKKVFGSLLAVGCSFSLVFQAMSNMAVAVGLFPVTGQPLPLISMGGTSIWFTSISIGIILSVSRDGEAEA